MLGREHFFLLVKRRLDGCVHHLGLGAKLFRLSGIHDRKKHQACTRALGTRDRPIQCATTALAPIDTNENARHRRPPFLFQLVEHRNHKPQCE